VHGSGASELKGTRLTVPSTDTAVVAGLAVLVVVVGGGVGGKSGSGGPLLPTTIHSSLLAPQALAF